MNNYGGAIELWFRTINGQGNPLYCNYSFWGMDCFYLKHLLFLSFRWYHIFARFGVFRAYNFYLRSGYQF